MLDYIIGDIKHIASDYIVLDNHGIGYRINTSSNSISRFELYEEYMVKIHMAVREDAIVLYGFYDEEELAMFELLIGVSSIGPKNALSVLSTLTPCQIAQAVNNNSIEVLSKAPGIGKKTASRIILELTDKIAKLNFNYEDSVSDSNLTINISKNSELDSAIEALVSLGYFKNDVEKVIASIDTEKLGIEEIIKLAIKKLA